MIAVSVVRRTFVDRFDDGGVVRDGKCVVGNARGSGHYEAPGALGVPGSH